MSRQGYGSYIDHQRNAAEEGIEFQIKGIILNK